MFPASCKSLPSPVEEEEWEKDDNREKNMDNNENSDSSNEEKESAEGSKKINGRKARSSSDVREAKYDVAVCTNTAYPVAPSHSTPPSSPPVATRPTSRRKKIWNSFRSHTRRLRGKSRDSNKEGSGDSPPDLGSGTTDEEGGQPEVTSRSYVRRWRSDTVRTVSSSSEIAMDSSGHVDVVADRTMSATVCRKVDSEERTRKIDSEERTEQSEGMTVGVIVLDKERLDSGDDVEKDSDIAGVTNTALFPPSPHHLFNPEDLSDCEDAKRSDSTLLSSKHDSSESSITSVTSTTSQRWTSIGSKKGGVFSSSENLSSSSLESFFNLVKTVQAVHSSSSQFFQSLQKGKSHANEDLEDEGATICLLKDSQINVRHEYESLLPMTSDQKTSDRELVTFSKAVIIHEPEKPAPRFLDIPAESLTMITGMLDENKSVERKPVPSKTAHRFDNIFERFEEARRSAFRRSYRQAVRLRNLDCWERLFQAGKTSLKKLKRLHQRRYWGRRWKRLKKYRLVRVRDSKYCPVQCLEIKVERNPTKLFLSESSSEIMSPMSNLSTDIISGIAETLQEQSLRENLEADVYFGDTSYLKEFPEKKVPSQSKSSAYESASENFYPELEGRESDDLKNFGDLDVKDQETFLRQRQNVVMEHPFFVLVVHLQEGRDLVIRDTCGTSDPYVKFKIGGKQLYRSRTIFKNLNPKWDEVFSIPVEDISKPVYVKVFDYDRGLHDDPMGTAEIDLTQLELDKSTDLKLLLSDRGKSDYMGYLLMTCTLQPKTLEDKDQYLHRSGRSAEAVNKKLKIQPWSGVLTIVLVEGLDLVPMDDNGLSDPYVKFRLGTEKYRSKHKNKTLSPRWVEQFHLRLFPDQTNDLEIAVYDYDVTGRDDFMGRATVDISKFEAEITHHIDVELEDGAGLLKLLLTISGTCTIDAPSDLSNYTPDSRQHDQLERKYSFFRLSDVADVGSLQVKVFKACGLKSADLSGQSDPFCVVELVNARLQTHTEYKTLNPEWNKVFNLRVRDIHSVLEVTVFDEDRDKKVEFLGKVAIPLLKIKSGERRWYALKDKKLLHRTKGAILLEMDFVYNHAKAALRTLHPIEEKFLQVEPKFKIHLMKRNIDRVSRLISTVVDGGKFLQSCFNWESTPRSATAFVMFLVIVWNFELYMLPITLLLIFLKNLIIAQILGALKKEQVEDIYFDEEEEDEDEDKEKEEKKSFKEKLQSIQDVCLQVQQGMDMLASLGERIKNTFNWTVPWLSILAVVSLSSTVFVLYFIPLRWLILAWGINKFTKKLRKPTDISNNEVLDFLSRVPSDNELAQYRELRPELSPSNKKKRS